MTCRPVDVAVVVAAGGGGRRRRVGRREPAEARRDDRHVGHGGRDPQLLRDEPGLRRPVQPGGRSYTLTGHHEIMLPLLAHLVLSRIAGQAAGEGER